MKIENDELVHEVGDHVVQIFTILRNALEVEVVIHGSTLEEVESKAGQVLFRIHRYLGETNQGTIVNITEGKANFVLEGVNDPKTSGPFNVGIEGVFGKVHFINKLD